MRAELIRQIGCLSCVAVLTACTLRSGSIASADAAVAGIAAVVELKRANWGPSLVLDSATLATVVGMDSAHMAKLAKLLAGKVEIAATSADAPCGPSRIPKCGLIYVNEYVRERDELTLRVAVYSIGACGDYDALFKVRTQGAHAEVVAVDDEDYGDCGRK
jgi:hypothetical protein